MLAVGEVAPGTGAGAAAGFAVGDGAEALASTGGGFETASFADWSFELD